MKQTDRSRIALTLFALALCSGLAHRSTCAQTAPPAAPGGTRRAAGSTAQEKTTPTATAGKALASSSLILLVSDYSGSRVHAYDVATGETLYELGGGADPIRNPTGIAIGPDGDLYVASPGTAKILRYDLKTKTFIDVLGSCSNCVQFQFDAGSNPLVLVSYPGNVDRFSAGAFTPMLTGSRPNSPNDMTHGADDWLYVTDGQGVHRYNPSTGADSRTFIPRDTGGLAGASGLAFGPDGDLYVSDAGTNMIKRYSATGEYVNNFVTDNHLSGPGHLRFGPDGNLYVINGRTGNVLEFQGPMGGMPGAFMKVAVEAGQGGLRTPHSLAFLNPAEPALGAPGGSTAADLAQAPTGTGKTLGSPVSGSGVAAGSQPLILTPSPVGASPTVVAVQKGNPLPTPLSTTPKTATASGTKAATPPVQSRKTTATTTKPVTPVTGGKTSATTTVKKTAVAPKTVSPPKPATPSPPPAPKH